MSHETITTDLDLDVYSFSRRIGAQDDTNESVFYIRTDLRKKQAMIAVSGDYNTLIAGLFSLFDNIKDSFKIVLDAVESYAEERDIDLETIWDEQEEQQQ